MENTDTEEVKLDIEAEAAAEGQAVAKETGDPAVEAAPVTEAKIEAAEEPKCKLAEPGKSALGAEEPSDPAAEAFTRLGGEIALVRRAVEHLASERADIVIPDYGATLTDMVKQLTAVVGSIANIAEQPAMQFTPDSLGSRIEAIAISSRRTDHERISQAQNELYDATQNMRDVTVHALTATEQRHRLFQGVGCGVITGILLWSFLPGTIARAVPESWHWPEAMAVGMLGEPSGWDAGSRLIRADDPQAWSAVVQAVRMAQANRQIVPGCIKKANAAGKPVQCTVSIIPNSE